MTCWVETCRPDKYTIVYKIKCCVIDGRVVFVCYNTSGWKTSKIPEELFFTHFSMKHSSVTHRALVTKLRNFCYRYPFDLIILV